MPIDPLAVVPAFALIFLGWAARSLKLMDKEKGKWLLDFTLLGPSVAATFLAIATTRLTPTDFLLPLAAAIFMLSMYFFSAWAASSLRLKGVQEGVFRIALMIPNTSFVLIFALPIFGAEGFTKIVLFDIANVLLIFSLVYYVAAKNSPANTQGAKNSPIAHPSFDSSRMFRKIFLFPPFLSALIALLFVAFNISLPSPLPSLLDPLSKLVFVLFAFSTGIFLERSIHNFRLVKRIVLLKMGFGFLFGLALVWLLGLQAPASLIVLAALSSPTGFNSLAFAAREELDVELAASAFFVSALIGIFTVPAILLFG